jgi:MYXO-CTERM domain-containing protein
VTLAPGKRVPFAIAFAQKKGGDYEGLVEVTSDDPQGRGAIGLRGRGLEVGLDTPTSEVDFGALRVGGEGSRRLLAVTNTGQASLKITHVELSTTLDFQTSLDPEVPLPARLGPGDSLGLLVVAQPLSMGTKRATITLRTDSVSVPMRDIGLLAEGVAPGILLSAEAVHFGGVDITQTTPASRALGITNTGSAVLTLRDLSITGKGKEAFRLGPSVLTSIAPGETSELPILYQPTKESSSELEATLAFSTDAPGATYIEVPLSGHGVDRHLTLSATALSFPSTRRNRQEASRLTLRIGNRGGAPLRLSRLAIEGAGAAAFALEPSWQEERVAPGASVDVVVAFRPGEAAAFDADLVIPSDDDENATARVRLVGLGVLAPLLVSPGLVDARTVAVGRSRQISPSVEIRNSSASETVTVARVCVASSMACVEGTSFRVLRAAGMTLSPREAVKVAVAFQPSEARRYGARLLVFADDDPEPQFIVELAGEGIDDVVVSGGGCQVGTGQPSSWLPWVLALLVVALRRRRGWGLGLLVVTLPMAPAFAQGTLDLSTFRPAPGGPDTFLAVEAPPVLARGTYSLGLTLDHATNLLVARRADMTVDRPVRGRTSLSMLGSYGISRALQLGLVVPLLYQTGDDEHTGVGAAQGGALGDLAVRGKLRIGGAGPFSLALGAGLTLPTGDETKYAGLGAVSGGAHGIVGLSAGAWQWAWNLGFRLRGREAVLLNVRQGDELSYALGGKVRVTRELDALAELFGAVGLGSETRTASPAEATLSVRYHAGDRVALTLGAGQGLRSGIGAPDLRMFVAVVWGPGPGAETQAPSLERAPAVDADRDGVLEDRCPAVAEDRDGFEDADGCPEADNDRDGLSDRTDRCPDVAEDRDQEDDHDGCPDADADRDGVPDLRDACADSDEDVDGFEDGDGCDDPDNDRDGIPDVIDACPLEPETINGSRDDDGCPDLGESLVLVSRERLLTLVPVEFVGEGFALRATSHNVLNQVARAMRAHVEIERLAIEVSAAARGQGSALALADARAQEILSFLVSHGVEPDRLTRVPSAGDVDQVDFRIVLQPSE